MTDNGTDEVTFEAGIDYASKKNNSVVNSIYLIFGLPLRFIDFLTLILSAIIADFFLYWDGGPAGYAGAVILWTLLAWITGTKNKLRTNAILLILLNILLAASCFWMIGFWNAFLPMIFIFASAVLSRSEHHYILDALFVSFISMILSPFRLLGHFWFLMKSISGRRKTLTSNAIRYFIPVFVSLILVLFFGWIFSKANPILANWFGWFFDYLERIVRKIIPDIERLWVWGFTAVVSAGLIKPFFAEYSVFQNELQNNDCEETSLKNLAGITALFALISTVIVFALNNLVDVFYLWGGSEIPGGITYSQYARQGASWLTFALFVSTILIGFASAEYLSGYRRNSTVRFFSWVWILLDILLVAGTLRRIQIYIGYNGMTVPRVTGIFGVLIVTAGLVAMAVKLWRRKNFFWILRRYISIFLIGTAIYGIFPDGWLSARMNTRWAMNGNKTVLVWLFENHGFEWRHRIGADALPELIPLLDYPDTVVSRGVSAYLYEELEQMEYRNKRHEWRRNQFAEMRAVALLRKERTRLIKDEKAIEELRQTVWNYR